MDQKELLLKLDETKAALETKAAEAATTAAKDEVALQLKAVNDSITEVKGLIPAEMKGFDFAKVLSDIKALTEQGEAFEIKFKQTGGGQKQVKSFDEVFRSALEEKTDDFAKMGRKEKGFSNISIDLDLKTVGDISTANVTGTTVWGAQYRQGIVEAPKRKLHMREIVPGGPVGPGTDFYFMKQNGNGEGGVATVAEGAAKSHTDEDLVETSVKIETIAGYERITRKALLNVPGMSSFLQSRLVEKLMKEEDRNILYGTGASPDMKGILVSGNFTASAGTGATLIEKIINDLALLEDTNERDCSAILLRPVDYHGFFLNKAGGSGEFDLPFNVTFVNGQLYISGVPVYKTTALTSGDYCLGDFNMGAQFLTQESMRIEFFEQDSDNVTKNKITVRIEETATLPVYGPDFFIKGTV